MGGGRIGLKEDMIVCSIPTNSNANVQNAFEFILCLVNCIVGFLVSLRENEIVRAAIVRNI